MRAKVSEPHHGTGNLFPALSPFAEEIILNLYLDGSKGEAFERHAMKRCEKGVWQYRTERNLHGIYYDFTLQMENSTVFSRIHMRVHAINGQRSMVVDLKKNGSGRLGGGQSSGKGGRNGHL